MWTLNKFRTLLQCFYWCWLWTFCFSNIISHFQLLRKENVIMSIKHTKFTLFCWHCWWHTFFIIKIMIRLKCSYFLKDFQPQNVLIFRISRPVGFLGNGVLKIWSKFTVNYPYRCVISIYTSAWVFPCKFDAYFHNTNTSGWLLLYFELLKHCYLPVNGYRIF